jgi:hypothetical protein
MATMADALVEHSSACSGKGRYIALVYFGSPSGRLHHQVFVYSHKDPRDKDEAVVLQEITRQVARRYRRFIVAISVVKRCLHPKSIHVAKTDRRPHYERLFSWVVRHHNSISQPPHVAKRSHFENLLDGHSVQSVMLPYTSEELERFPIKDMITTSYLDYAHASVSVRGLERIVDATELLSFSR